MQGSHRLRRISNCFPANEFHEFVARVCGLRNSNSQFRKDQGKGKCRLSLGKVERPGLPSPSPLPFRQIHTPFTQTAYQCY
jgi:hypothetical protein